MFAFESKLGRRFVGVVERSEELHAAIKAFAEKHDIQAASIRVMGALKWAELTHDHDAKPTRIDQPCQIVALSGFISMQDDVLMLRLQGALMLSTSAGPSLVGGYLSEAEVALCEVVLETFDDIELMRSFDANTGVSAWLSPQSSSHIEAIRPPPTPLPPDAATGDLSWAAVVAKVSADENKKRIEEVERNTWPVRSGKVQPIATQRLDRHTLPATKHVKPEPKRGDELVHPVFGKCFIETQPVNGTVRIRLGNGTRKTIKLDMFEVEAQVQEHGKGSFHLLPKVAI